MNESILQAESTLAPDELRAFKKGVGYVMYEVFDKIIEPVVKRHPSLKPPEMDD